MAKGILDRIKNKRPALYTDIDISMEPHPVSGDLVLNSDEKAITQALRFLILTNLGERLYQPELGGDMTRNLFSLLTPAYLRVIKEKVETIIRNYEKRIDLVGVDVVAFDEAVNVKVIYTIRNNESILSTNVMIKRDR